MPSSYGFGRNALRNELRAPHDERVIGAGKRSRVYERHASAARKDHCGQFDGKLE
jgi:hypothetical protein